MLKVFAEPRRTTAGVAHGTRSGRNYSGATRNQTNRLNYNANRTGFQAWQAAQRQLATGNRRGNG